MKKAGIVVGVTIIILAVALYWVVGNMKKDRAEGTTPSAQTLTNSKQTENKANTGGNKPDTTTQSNSVTTAPTQQSGNTTTTPVQPITPVQKQVFKELDESELGNPITVRTEIMVVSSKKIILMDSNFGENNGKQLVYCVDLIYGDGTLNFYLNGTTYQNLKVGDKLKVDYQVYKNNQGVSFPVIMSVDAVQ